MSSTVSGKVFLSYASQDAEAARRIYEALRAFGVEVWFDQSELRGGDEWDARIREQIRRCDLFLPVISATTQGRREGYFRREWKLAADRTHDMASGSAFLFPIIIDDTTDAAALIPDEFRRVQFTRLPRGVPTTAFIETIRRALEPVATPANDAAPAPRASGATRPTPRRKLLLPAALAAALVLGLAAWWLVGQRSRGASGPPVVLLMDSPYAERVYDPKTLASGGTNADDITDALHLLPITLIKENTSATWRREPEVIKVNPDLIVMHRSCFYAFPDSRLDEMGPLIDNKLVAFLGYVASQNPRVKFIVYSRHSFENDADAAKWREEAAARFPALAGKIETWRVPLDRATFRSPLTAQELRASVERALGLHTVARGS